MAPAESTREISRAEWNEFFDGFSRRHRGWLATVEEVGPTTGAMVESRRLPFEGIFADPRGEGSVTLLLGREPDKHVEHSIAAPKRVWLETLEGGAEAALEIESGAGRKTILSFEHPRPSEMVDGLVRTDLV
jgi:Family of unknown function (DUF5335)